MRLDEPLLRKYLELDPGGAFLRQVVETFVTQSVGTADAMQDALAAGDAAELAAAAHKLRGGTGSVGLTEATRLCAEIEAQANEGALGRAATLVADCRRELAHGVAALEAFVAAR